MEKKICIITGANAGIGKQAAFQIAKKNMHVILACRSRERGEAALRELMELESGLSAELAIIDMGSFESIKSFAADFSSRFEKLDVIIHNAAVFNVTQKERKENSEGLETVWATNHLGPVLLTELLLEKLKKSENGRVLTVSSKGLLAKPFMKVDTADPEFKSRKFSIVNAYYQSKLAQVMYTYRLAERLENTDVTVNCIRVTAVKVDISRHPELSEFMKKVYAAKAKKSISPEKMAETYTELAVSEKYSSVTGKYFDENCREVSSSGYSRSRRNIDDVMTLTKKYIPELGEV